MRWTRTSSALWNSTEAVVPQLRAAAPAAVLNVLSVLSWFSMPESRVTLRGQVGGVVIDDLVFARSSRPYGVRVSALHVGYMDTDMTKGIDGPKSDPCPSRALRAGRSRGKRRRDRRR